LPDFIGAAVNGHDEVAVMARLADGREQERAQKFPEQQVRGTVSILHNHQAREFSQYSNKLLFHIACPGWRIKSTIMSPQG